MLDRELNRSLLLQNLVYLYVLTRDGILTDPRAPQRLFIYWDLDKVLCEYPRPTVEQIKGWLADIAKELQNVTE